MKKKKHHHISKKIRKSETAIISLQSHKMDNIAFPLDWVAMLFIGAQKTHKQLIVLYS